MNMNVGIGTIICSFCGQTLTTVFADSFWNISRFRQDAVDQFGRVDLVESSYYDQPYGLDSFFVRIFLH